MKHFRCRQLTVNEKLNMIGLIGRWWDIATDFFAELLGVCKVVVAEGTNNTFDAHIICICCCASVCRKQNFVKNSVRSSITYLKLFL